MILIIKRVAFDIVLISFISLSTLLIGKLYNIECQHLIKRRNLFKCFWNNSCKIRVIFWLKKKQDIKK
jgi:hypothetical protein